ncbi:MAG: helix-hairpin-helix domain-containing protein [Ruminococcus sp.]|nr:helix-hairpin-helix domain-containing protein [Ruminococcus sp.]MCI7495320.1 helix-hairpin-helix domain-containing protein [Ruminococcus sp.]MDD6431182.1 helix-hairpin-helix domain-containing protein [Ruminococcus sp.]
MKRKQLWKPLLGLAMMGTAVVVLAVQSFAEQDTIPAITWVTTASEESAESEPQTEPLETEADSENANRQPVFDWDKPTKAETTTKSAGSTTAPVRQIEPAQPDAAELAFPEEAEPEISYPLDLNAATAEELETLPGVGAILAERIVSYREAVGGFQTLEELQQVNGIGSGIYFQIAPYLFIIGELQTISPESELPEATDAAAPELEPETAPESASASIPRLDINIATAEDFQKLPNVTQEQAEAIVRLRTQIQYFQNIYELLYADGMTDRLFLSIRDYLYVSFA